MYLRAEYPTNKALTGQ